MDGLFGFVKCVGDWKWCKTRAVKVYLEEYDVGVGLLLRWTEKLLLLEETTFKTV